MGVVVKSEIVAYQCQVAQCGHREEVTPMKSGSTFTQRLPQLAALVESGWSLVLTSRMRSYCPEHADRCWDCTCRTHPERGHLCTAHSANAAGMVWDSVTVPASVAAKLGKAAA